MTVRLTRDAEAYIEQQVRAGRFRSAEEAIDAAVERLRHDDETEFAPGELDSLIAQGECDLAAGRSMTLEQLERSLLQKRSN